MFYNFKKLFSRGRLLSRLYGIPGNPLDMATLRASHIWPNTRLFLLS